MILFIMLFTYYLTKLCFYMPAYKDMDQLIEYNLVEFPDQFAAWNWKGILMREKGRIFAALNAFQHGLKYNPRSFRLNYNTAMVFKLLGTAYKKQYEYFLEKAGDGIPEDLLQKHIEALQKEERNFLMKSMNLNK